MRVGTGRSWAEAARFVVIVPFFVEYTQHPRCCGKFSVSRHKDIVSLVGLTHGMRGNIVVAVTFDSRRIRLPA